MPRKSPCSSCPYRRTVPSGVWAGEEYDRLAKYDGEIWEQVTAGAVTMFMCHQGEGDVCSGWLAHRGDPYEMLAVRIALSDGRLSPLALDYETTVPLFASGAAAAEHGKAAIEHPSPKAEATIDKIVRKRGL